MQKCHHKTTGQKLEHIFCGKKEICTKENSLGEVCQLHARSRSRDDAIKKRTKNMTEINTYIKASVYKPTLLGHHKNNAIACSQQQKKFSPILINCSQTE